MTTGVHCMKSGNRDGEISSSRETDSLGYGNEPGDSELASTTTDQWAEDPKEGFLVRRLTH